MFESAEGVDDRYKVSFSNPFTVCSFILNEVM